MPAHSKCSIDISVRDLRFQFSISTTPALNNLLLVFEYVIISRVVISHEFVSCPGGSSAGPATAHSYSGGLNPGGLQDSL